MSPSDKAVNMELVKLHNLSGVARKNVEREPFAVPLDIFLFIAVHSTVTSPMHTIIVKLKGDCTIRAKQDCIALDDFE